MEPSWRNRGTFDAVLDGHLWLRKNSLKPEDLARFRSELAVTSATNNFMTGKPTAMFSVAEDEEGDEWFGVPPYYRSEGLPGPQHTVEHLGLEIQLVFGGAFTAWRTDYDQKGVVDTMLAVLQKDGAAQLCIDTGMGKTLIALFIICALGRKALVIVHKKDSITQWTKQAQRFLPGCKIGELRANVRRYEGMDIVITTVQSLSRGKYSEAVLDQFGFVIADEIHLMAAEVFHLAFTYVRSRYRLGLTATPERKDGLQQVIEWFFSVPAVTLSQPRSDVNVRIIHYKAGEQTPLWIGRPANMKPNLVGMIGRLTVDEWRNKLSVKEACEQAQATTGQSLIISERKQHTYTLTELITAARPTRRRFCAEQYDTLVAGYMQPQCVFSRLNAHLIAAISKHMWVEELLTVAVMTGDHTDAQRQAAKTADIVCATMQLAKESLDMPNLTRVQIETPVSKNIIQQLRGRLLRTTEAETQARGQDLVLTHLFDDWEEPSMLSGMFWGCNRFYQSQGYKIKHFTFTTEDMEKLFPVE
jgi:superfamily II DNA or RNA helicase